MDQITPEKVSPHCIVHPTWYFMLTHLLLSEFGETDKDMLDAAIKRFTRSCAGYSVATYVLVRRSLLEVNIKSHDCHMTPGHRRSSQWQHHGYYFRKSLPHWLWTLPWEHKIFHGIPLVLHDKSVWVLYSNYCRGLRESGLHLFSHLILFMWWVER